MKIRLGALVLCGTVTVVGCATDTNDRTPPQLDAKLTYDGLAQVKNTKVKGAWMRPDFTLAGYTKIMLQGAGIEYRPVKKVNRAGSTSGTQFPLTDEQKERLRTIVSDAFRAELAQTQKFQLVDQPGPDVLMIWGGLVDVVSYVPPESIGRGNVYLNSVGEATLVIEIRDSQSNAVLVRVVDRRAAQSSGVPLPSSSVTNWSEVQRLARTWASLLRTRLEEAAQWDL